MASLFMRVHGLKDVKGSSDFVGDVKTNSDGDTFEIEGIDWKVGRGINMDVGNGNNSDTGKLTSSNIVVTKEVDGLTPSLMTILFKPKKGRVVDFIYAVPNPSGKGLTQQYVFTIDGARIVDCKLTTETSDEDGSVPMEKITFAFGSIVSKYIPTDITGAMGEATADIVVYDFGTGELESGTDMK